MNKFKIPQKSYEFESPRAQILLRPLTFEFAITLVVYDIHYQRP